MLPLNEKVEALDVLRTEQKSYAEAVRSTVRGSVYLWNFWNKIVLIFLCLVKMQKIGPQVMIQLSPKSSALQLTSSHYTTSTVQQDFKRERSIESCHITFITAYFYNSSTSSPVIDISLLLCLIYKQYHRFVYLGNHNMVWIHPVFTVNLI